MTKKQDNYLYDEIIMQKSNENKKTYFRSFVKNLMLCRKFFFRNSYIFVVNKSQPIQWDDI